MDPSSQPIVVVSPALSSSMSPLTEAIEYDRGLILRLAQALQEQEAEDHG